MLVEAPALRTEANFDVNGVMTTGKTILGIMEGDSGPDVFIPRLVERYVHGRFPFDRMVKFYSFDQMNQAAKDSKNGLNMNRSVGIGS